MIMKTFIFILITQLNAALGLPNKNPVTSHSRIIGGSDAAEGVAKHMVALVAGNPEKFLNCGGSIVTERIVLTAAHCLIGVFGPNGTLDPFFYGVVGSNKWQSTKWTITFISYEIHPNYMRWDNKYDAAILVTAGIINMNDKIQQISLNFEEIPGEEDSYVTGWGRRGEFQDGFLELLPVPDHLQILYVTTLDGEQCVQDMKIISDRWPHIPHVNKTVEICTLHSVGHGNCYGDSGSALVKLKTEEQIGIVSWGYPCALGAPDIYVRMSGIKDFMFSVLSNPIYK